MSTSSTSLILNSHNVEGRRDSQVHHGSHRRHSTVRLPHHLHTEGHIHWLHSIEFETEVMCCKFSGNGTLFAVGLASGFVKIFKSDIMALVHELSTADMLTSPLPCTSLHFIPKTSKNTDQETCLLATYASGLTRIWQLKTGACLQQSNEKKQALCSSVNPNQTRYVVGGDHPEISLYDIEASTPVATLSASEKRDVMNGHRSRILAIQYHPDEPHLIVSGGWDDTVQFWDERREHAVRKIYGPHICGDGIDIDAARNHLLTGSWRKDNVLQVWDIRSGAKLKDVPQDSIHHCQLYCCQWLGADHMICGGTDQNMVRLVDKSTLNTVGQVVGLQQGVFCIDHDKTVNNHPRILVGSGKFLHVLRQETK